MSRRVSSDRLVGRADELAVGMAALQRVLDGGSQRSAQVLLISGEAGIGKTRLLDELLRCSQEAGAATGSGQCLDHGGEIRPLTAVADILADLRASTPGDGSREPRAVGREDELSATPAEASARIFDEVRSRLRRLSARGPVVLGVEDLHWSDRTTRGLMAELIRVRGLERVLLIATFRSDELHRRHPLLPLLADLEQTGRPEQIDLTPLTEADMVELAEAILDRQIDREWGEELQRRTGGNPFYAEELLAIQREGGEPAGRLPAGVRHVILGRSQNLGSDAVQCLQAASTLAAPIDSTVLRATTGLEPEQYRPAVDTLCRERFLIGEPAGFRFRHELVREVFLDELLPGERTDLLARAALALEVHRPERLGERARLHMGAAQPAEALATSVDAAAAAAGIGAPAEAGEHYGRALELWDRVADAAELTGVTHIELVRRAAEMADLARDFDRAVELARKAIREAAAAGDRFQEGAVNVELAGYLWNASRPGMEEATERALELLPPEPPTVERARVELRAARVRAFAGDPDADAALESVAAMAAEIGERGIEVAARAHVGIQQAGLGDDDALRNLSDGLRQAIALDDGPAGVVIAVNLTNTLINLGRYQEAAEFYDEGVALAERHGLGATLGIVFEGNVLLALEPLGRWDEAGQVMDDIRRRLSPETMQRWASAFLGWTQIQINRGHHAEVVDHYRRGLEMWETGYYNGDILPVGTGLIQLAGAASIEPIDTETVAAWLGEARPGDSVLAARMVATAARNLIPPPNDPDHRRVVDTVTGWIEELQDRVDEYVAVPPALETWLDQARIEVAEAAGQPMPDRWAGQVSAWDGLGCPFFATEARHRQADAMLRAGGGRSGIDRAEATGLLTQARRMATALRAEPLRREIDDLARRARLRLDAYQTGQVPAAPSEPSPFGLTDREVQVLRLVNEGHSNGEIGAALFISVKTASVHVSNILRKLGAANRIEAAAIARRHRLVGSGDHSSDVRRR